MNLQKIQFEITSLLPEVEEANDSCNDRLIRSLNGHPGVQEAHLKEETGKLLLCLHYDSNRLNLDRLKLLTQQAGAAIPTAIGTS